MDESLQSLSLSQGEQEKLVDIIECKLDMIAQSQKNTRTKFWRTLVLGEGAILFLWDQTSMNDVSAILVGIGLFCGLCIRYCLLASRVEDDSLLINNCFDHLAKDGSIGRERLRALATRIYQYCGCTFDTFSISLPSYPADTDDKEVQEDTSPEAKGDMKADATLEEYLKYTWKPEPRYPLEIF